ncbi:MAG: manganese efflux pump MntP family protein [Acutalibacteraceae bacterium]|nr:manganese efflux pump MntP family protein [Acutalibacteraceae bacterium]
MDYISVICIAIGLAMDAFAVSVSNGATTRNLKLPYAIKLSLFFGGFQFLMPVIGWIVGKAGEGFISQVDHWVAFVLLGFIGGKMIADYIKEKKEEISTEKKERLSNRTIFVLAIATSIDALATGVILPSAVGASTYKLMLVSVIIIGVITFIICMLGVYLGKLFGVLLSRYSTIFGGTVLILIGGKILFEHLILK